MRKWLLAAAALLGLTSSAFAVCPSPLTGKDAANTTQNFGVTVDGGGNCYGNVALVDGTAAANKAAVNASGQLAVAGPVTNAGTFAVQAAQSGTWNITNISGTVSLPTGAATSALQTTGNTALTTINTTLGSPFQAGGSIGNTTFAVTQATSSNLKAQVDPLTAASWGIGTATQNSTSATNGQLALAQFNTSPTTITAGNMSPLQLDNAGNLLVNIKAGAGSGGTAITDNAAFTTGTTSETPIGCYAGTPSATANHSTIVACTTAGSVHTTVDNTNANGQALAANSSPVVAPVLTVAGAAVVKASVPVVNGGNFFQAVAASQTATTLQQSTGAAGDYLSHCDIYPTSTSPGVVTVFDNTNTAANSAILFAGGASSLSNLAPIPVPVGALSVSGAWKVTTGANVSVVCYGRFS